MVSFRPPSSSFSRLLTCSFPFTGPNQAWIPLERYMVEYLAYIIVSLALATTSSYLTIKLSKSTDHETKKNVVVAVAEGLPSEDNLEKDAVAPRKVMYFVSSTKEDEANERGRVEKSEEDVRVDRFPFFFPSSIHHSSRLLDQEFPRSRRFSQASSFTATSAVGRFSPKPLDSLSRSRLA